MTERSAVSTEIRWPGVVVVGGGATGLLTALELDGQGFAALVVEEGNLCSRQTGQAHGWLHRGGVFPDARTEDFEQLDEGARRWTELIERTGNSGAVTGCRIGGVSQRTLAAVTATWEQLRLPYQHTATTTGACDWMIRAPESAIVPVRALQAALADSGVALRRAEAVKLLPGRSGSTVESLLARAGQRTFRLTADAFVLANGAGITALLPEGQLSSAVVRRLSFMLVTRTDAAMHLGVAIPEQEALGLFAVPRVSGGHRYVLLSNFISYAPTAELTHSRDNWLAGIRPTVQRFLPDLWQAQDALWGVYSAVKAEPARHLALGVSEMALLPSLYGNVVAGVPGKLTLAPLLAERLADAVAPHIRHGEAADGLIEDLPAARWGPEEWEVTPLVRRSTLFRESWGHQP